MATESAGDVLINSTIPGSFQRIVIISSIRMCVPAAAE